MSYIIGTGHYYPDQVVSNDQIEQRLQLEPGWILRRTGFSSRRYCDANQAVSDMAMIAAEESLSVSGIDRSDIGLVLLATSTPDYLLPGTAPAMASALNISAPAMDLMAACTGFLHAVSLADAWVKAFGTPVLVVAANVLSRRVNPSDAQTIGLFGDGAGAVVVSPDLNRSSESFEIVGSNGANRGDQWKQLYIPVGGIRQPFDSENVNSQLRYMQMDSGREVFKLAVESMQHNCESLLRDTKTSQQQIDWLIPHQASLRIVLELAKRLSISQEKAAWWLGDLGNSSAATIPIALSIGQRNGRFQAGQNILLAAAGSGMSSGSALLRVIED